MRSSRRESMRVRAVWYSARSSFRRGLARSESEPSGSNDCASSSASVSSVGSVVHASKSDGRRRAADGEEPAQHARGAERLADLADLLRCEHAGGAHAADRRRDVGELDHGKRLTRREELGRLARLVEQAARLGRRRRERQIDARACAPCARRNATPSAASRRFHSRSLLVLSGQGSRSCADTGEAERSG